MRRGLAIPRHLLEMIRDAVDLDGRLLDCFGRTIRSLGRFVRRGLRLRRGLFGVLRCSLSLGGRSLGLLGLLLVAASRDRDRENHYRQR